MADDPLVRMPGTQPAQNVALESPNKCDNCHDAYDPNVDPAFFWRGSMMAQAARDPVFWATFVVALQDSIWLLGTPNAGDLCLRCHTPPGWLGGRSDPPNASALTGADFDGVTCDSCHRMIDPFFEQTFAGTREGSDWVGYWDETDLSARPSSTEAQTTRQADQTETGLLTLFNGKSMYDPATYLPALAGWNENASGQYIVSTSLDKRASFADTNEKHGRFYSRFHKSRYFCAACHDVSNPVVANLPYANTPPGNGTTTLPSEMQPANSYGHVERTFSEFMLSSYAVGAGAFGTGAFAPSTFKTSHPGNRIASCQDCHMPDRVGAGCNKSGTLVRPAGSTEHPKSGQPLHDLTGGNTWVPWLLASTVAGSPNYDATNASLLKQGAAALTLDFSQGQALDANALLDSVVRATQNLQRAASIEALSYTPSSGALSFRVRNHTGHKLISGYPEGRRVFVTVKSYVSGSVAYTINPYSASAATLKGLGTATSPPLGANEKLEDNLVYEARTQSTATGEAHTFHFVLSSGRVKDNRIPPQGFRINEAAARLVQPVINGVHSPTYFTAAEYAGGFDDVQLTIPAGADGVEVSVYYQSTSREYVEFLRDEIKGTGATLTLPPPSGETNAYIAQTDPYFSALKAWGDTLWQLWDHNKTVPGAAPVLMAQSVWGSVADPCAASGSDGTPCNDASACTLNDVCASGSCVGTALVCVAQDACHDAGSCSPSTGMCSNPAKPDGTTCSDGSACTVSDKCASGVCVPGTAVSCTPIDECHLATCSPATGSCVDSAKPDGSSCSIGECVGGVCTAIPDGGVGGSAGTGGSAGIGGVGGSAGTGASAGIGGSAGTGGSAGSGGSAVGGSAGVAGSGGSAGSAGSGGSAVGGSGGSAVGGSGGSAVGGSGGSAVGGSAGTGGAAGSANAAGSEDDGGCGCRTRSSHGGDGSQWLALLALAGLIERRRRLRA